MGGAGGGQHAHGHHQQGVRGLAPHLQQALRQHAKHVKEERTALMGGQGGGSEKAASAKQKYRLTDSPLDSQLKKEEPKILISGSF